MSTVDLSVVTWRKSSYSSNTGNEDACVEVAFAGNAVVVRDSKAPASGALVLPGSAWAHFVTEVR